MDKSSSAYPSPSGPETNGVSEVNEHASPGAPNDGAFDAELDGDESDPIVICGFSLKFPQEATSAEAFWKMMVEKRCAMTQFPPNRLNPNGFHQSQKRLQTLPLRGGHFIQDDLSVFDADFFSISPTEASAMDPMQRWLLETTFRAFENAGMPIESIYGSSTAVYTGSFCFDYMLQLSRDAECAPTYSGLSFGLSMLANRLSWFFDLRGPSISLDSACSSTAMAVDIACQSLRSGSCSMAVVAGSNLAISPEPYLWMSNMNFLSPDSRCYSFDHRANGYARGEGIGVIILKKLSDAIRDGNTIRAVIRSTGSNEDGRTAGITQPSRAAQESLIKETYRKAGLSMKHTRYFEAHGTGTAIGDPREARAIGSAFQKYRSRDDPIYAGSVKSNIGHLEGASGIAAIIKSVLVLEKGIIAPNANFEKLNPQIDGDSMNLRFPTKPIAWPTPGLRRISINSFGFGGANSHIVLDDAYNYLRMRSLGGNHCTRPLPPCAASASGPANGLPDHECLNDAQKTPKLLVWSAADEDGIDRISKAYEDFYRQSSHNLADEGAFLRDLAYTLAIHRSRLQWRSFAVLRTTAELDDLQSRISTSSHMPSGPARIGFIFSGQGAQWFAMGRGLLCYDYFRASLERAAEYLHGLGCRWSVMDELARDEELSNIDRPEFSQAICTVLQVALVDLIGTFNVEPSAVVGHSSGEIAAAYAGGYLDRESAWKLAYYRGLCAAELSEQAVASQATGAMMAVGLSEDEARPFVNSIADGASDFGLTIACVNSPRNVTVSGEAGLIDKLKSQLEEDKVFARKLRVTVAYHSPQMAAIASEYTSMMGVLSAPEGGKTTVPLVSTVTGETITAEDLLEPLYWTRNMVSPVRFSHAIANMCSESPDSLVNKIDKSHHKVPVVSHLLEIGPRAALQGPVRDILRDSPRGTSIGYSSVLRRGLPATEAMMQAMGELYCIGASLHLCAINEPFGTPDSPPSMLVDIPEYPFNHSRHFWHESRLSRNYRLRSHPPSELLGVRSNDWNASDARWRHFIRTSEMPWVEQHVVNGVTLYPGAGMLVMAIEAAKQLASETNENIKGYLLRDVRLEGPMDLSSHGGTLETQTSLCEVHQQTSDTRIFEFTIRTHVNSDWRLNCRGSIAVEFHHVRDSWYTEHTNMEQHGLSKKVSDLIDGCQIQVEAKTMYSFLQKSGYEYGPAFQAAQNQYCNRRVKTATAAVSLFQETDEEHVVHPISLDAILHLGFTALTSGGSQSVATSIPSSIACLWLSADGLSYPSEKTVTAYAAIDHVTRRGFSYSGGAMSSRDPGEVRLMFEGVELTNVTSTPPPAALPNPEQFCMNVDLKVALNMLSHDETIAVLNRMHPADEDLTEFFLDIERLIKITLERLSETIDPGIVENGEPWVKHYWNWTQHHLARLRDQKSGGQTHSPAHASSNALEDLSADLENKNAVGRLYVAMAASIESILRGQASPHELFFQTGLLKNYYRELGEYRCSAQAASYMDLFVHQNPGSRILEVGGGTASATREHVAALRTGSENSKGSLRCSRYDWTDISAAFLEQAKAEFGHYGSQMTFSTLDIERDLVAQGIEEGTYDVVVADGVLHVTSDFVETLKNIRKALKPGGKLIMKELLMDDGWTAGFVFGVFPGWWFGADEKRPLSSNLSAEDWDIVMRQSGFSGADIVLRDFDSDVAHHFGSIISTAVESGDSQTIESRQPCPAVNAVIIIRQTSEPQRRLAVDLQVSMSRLFGSEPVIETLDTVNVSTHPERNRDDFIIFLADYGSSFLGELDEVSWTYLRHLVKTSRRLLWVSAGGGPGADPSHGLLDGVARTLRSEYFELHLVTIALEFSDVPGPKSQHLLNVAGHMLKRMPHDNYEQDFIEIDGHLHTRRLTEATELKANMDANLVTHNEVQIPLGQVHVKLPTRSPWSDHEAACYVEAVLDPDDDLEPDEVAIAVKAVSLPAEDCAIALGEGQDDRLGSYCAGLVVEAGPDAPFRPGDHVIAAKAGCFRSHVRCSSRAVVKIPADISFSRACSIAPHAALAYHALAEVGRVRPGDRVFVYDGASPSGQAALQFLNDSGITDVWTTAEDEDDSTLIMQHSKIPPENIIPRSWIYSQPILISRLKQSFNVVFLSHGNFDPLFIPFVRSGGRYIATGSAPVLAGSAQRLPPSMALLMFRLEPQALTPESLQYASRAMATFSMEVTKHRPREFGAPALTELYSHLQRMDNAEMSVVNMVESDIVTVRMHKQQEFSMNPQATYLIAGGLGGLGRDMARWLVARGARYLILLSRSGPRTVEAQDMLAKFQEQGVHAIAPVCDVSDAAALKTVLANASVRLPPIKGCIQASMVLTERVFDLMEYRDWKVTTDPKVKGSWNLHTLLPRDLDFFVLLSSAMGVLGGGSLLAYSAANSYQDALSRYRLAQGERAIALNLGAVRDGGYLIERSSHIPGVLRRERYTPIYVRELCAVLDIYCNPQTTQHAVWQTVIGLRPPSHWRHVEEVPFTMCQPFWGHLHHLAPPADGGNSDVTNGERDHAAQQHRNILGTVESITTADSLVEAAELAAQALTYRVAALLGTDTGRLDAQKPMHLYGLDSLSAIDIRSWVAKAFDVDMPIFEILGGATFASAGMDIARALRSRK